MSLSEFFDPALTRTVTLSPSGKVLVGYYDINDLSVYMNDSVAGMGAAFVCELFDDWESCIGNEVTFDNFVYRINSINPDGTGIVTLELFRI